MSLILGAWHNADSATNGSVAEMYLPLQQLPQEKYQTLQHDHIEFGHLLTYNTPAATAEKMPVLLSDPNILVTAEGRIDNRSALLSRLGFNLTENYSDGFIISECFRKWGKTCVHYLKGNWSLAVYDIKEQELFLAVSPTGYATLYYHHNENGFYFSSSIKSIKGLRNYKKELNELHFVRFLTMWDDTQTEQETYFKNIYNIPLGHQLTIKDKKIVVQKYWQPQNIAIQKNKNKSDYDVAMLEIFTQSVSNRLRSNNPVAAMLSGGLDSSSVSYIAADLLRKQNKILPTFTHAPLFKDLLQQDNIIETRIVDETPLVMDIAKASGNISPTFLDSNNFSVLKGMTDWISICNAPSHASGNLYWLLDIYSTVSNNGYSTLLNGSGGNGTISFAGFDYLLPLSFKQFITHPYKFCRNQIAKPIAKAYFNKFLNRKRDISNSLSKYVSNIFLRESILGKYNILSDISENSKEIHKPIWDIQNHKSLFIDLFYPRSTIGTACGQHHGIELRDPTTAEEVIEYFFTLPNEAFFDEHYNNRMLVKRMMQGKLPDSVLFEKRKGLQSADIVYRVKAQAEEITAAIKTVCKSPAANHYINTEQLLATWQQYLLQPQVEPYQMQRLLKALQFALFLQMNFD